MASQATLVFSSARYRFRCTDIVFLLLAGFSIPSLYLLDLSSFLVPSYSLEQRFVLINNNHAHLTCVPIAVRVGKPDMVGIG